VLYAEIDSEIGKDEAADKSEKVKYSLWNKWEESVYIYLDSIIGKSGAPLPHVIRKDHEERTKWSELDRKTQQIHTASLEGFTVNIDSKRVLTLPEELCLDTEAETWFRNMKALQLHYDGPDESKRRKHERRSRTYITNTKVRSRLRSLLQVFTMHSRF